MKEAILEYEKQFHLEFSKKGKKKENDNIDRAKEEEEEDIDNLDGEKDFGVVRLSTLNRLLQGEKLAKMYLGEDKHLIVSFETSRFMEKQLAW